MTETAKASKKGRQGRPRRNGNRKPRRIGTVGQALIEARARKAEANLRAIRRVAEATK